MADPTEDCPVCQAMRQSNRRDQVFGAPRSEEADERLRQTMEDIRKASAEPLED